MNKKSPYTPQTLPLQSLDWGRLVTHLGDAHEGVARFDALVANMPDARLLMSPLTTQEAVLSSRIEGTQATLQEVLRFQADGKAEGEKRDDIVEVINYRNAIDDAFDAMEKLPLSGRLIKDAHRTLLSGARGKQKDPGNFRSGQVLVGAPGASVENARYVPPEAQLVPQLFSNLEKYMYKDEKNVLVQLAIVHAQFEIIHPFWDGNGRIGRLLMPLFLFQKKAISTPYFYISEYLEKHRSEYYESLNRITAVGDWEQWIEFFLHALSEQSRSNAAKAQAVIDLKENILLRVQEVTRSQYTPQITNFICSEPWFTGVDFRDKAGIPRPSATRLLNSLESGGIIEKLVAGKGGRTALCCFPEMVALL